MGFMKKLSLKSDHFDVYDEICWYADKKVGWKVKLNSLEEVWQNNAELWLCGAPTILFDPHFLLVFVILNLSPFRSI